MNSFCKAGLTAINAVATMLTGTARFLRGPIGGEGEQECHTFSDGEEMRMLHEEYRHVAVQYSRLDTSVRSTFVFRPRRECLCQKRAENPRTY